MRLDGLIVTFTTGDRIFASGIFDNVDLSTKATSQMAATGFAAPSLAFTVDLKDFLSGEVAHATRKSDVDTLIGDIADIPREHFADGAREA